VHAANPLFWGQNGILFARTINPGTMEANTDVWRMRADGTHQRRLTTGLDEEADAVWAPNGKKIAYTDYGPGNDTIYVMNADGSNAHPVTSNSTTALEPAWSPDGKRLAYRGFAGTVNYQIGVVKANGDNPHLITSDPRNHWTPSWTADGKRILYAAAPSGYDDLYSVRPDGTGKLRLTKTAHWDETAPVESPDGNHLAFRLFGDTQPDLQIAIADTDAKHRRLVTNDAADHYDPAWSPSGESLSYLANPSGQYDVFTIQRDGTHRHNLTKSTTPEFFRD
jgi:Tol biopolymer transport system component